MILYCYGQLFEGRFSMTLGDKIRKYRLLKELTQAQLGAKVKLTGDRIRQYENDVRKPKDGKLFEICDALEINPTALLDSDYNEPNSVMHTLFELEDIYGLHFEKVGDAYQLAFSKGEDYQNPNWLIEGIASWAKKRNELQPDINDSAATITDKKKEYAIWKARYPYNLGEDISQNFVTMDRFNSKGTTLIKPDRKSITTFAELYKTLLVLDESAIPYLISLDDNPDKLQVEIRFQIDMDYIVNASDDIKTKYMEFRECWYDLKKIGIEILECPSPVNDTMTISLSTPCKQVITMLEAHRKLQEKKSSPAFDEDDFKYEVDNIIKMFNVKIKDYV